MAYLAKWMRRCLFICIFSFFLMSHNASALVSQDVVFYGSGTATFDVSYTGGTLSCTGGCNYTQNTHSETNSNFNTLYLSLPAGTFQSDTVFRYDLNIFKINSSQSVHSAFNSLQVSGASSSIFSIYDIEYQQLDTNSTMVSIYLKLTKNNISFSSSSKVQLNSSTPFPYNYILSLEPTERVSGAMRYHFSILNSSASTDAIVNAINSQTDYSSNLNQINNNLNNINNGISDVKDAIENQNKEEKQETQDASDDAAEEIAGDSENAATSNLIGIISNFISSISDFTGGDCNLSLSFPSYAGGTLNVNVCQNKDKAGNIIEVFTSLTLIVFYLPLALKLLSMIYNEIRSFTNG